MTQFVDGQPVQPSLLSGRIEYLLLKLLSRRRPPCGELKTKSSGALPSTIFAKSSAKNRGIGTMRT